VRGPAAAAAAAAAAGVLLTPPCSEGGPQPLPAATTAAAGDLLTPRDLITSAARLTSGALQAAQTPLTPRTYLQVSFEAGVFVADRGGLKGGRWLVREGGGVRAGSWLAGCMSCDVPWGGRGEPEHLSTCLNGALHRHPSHLEELIYR
jgi:hypothetical protein